MPNLARSVMTLRRAIIVLGGIAAGGLVILITAAILLPRLIDTQVVKSRIGALVIEEGKGDVSVGKIDLVWLPRPSIVIDGVALNFDKNTAGTIRRVTVYPSIFYLLAGRLIARRARFQEPKFRFQLPARTTKPFDPENLEQEIRVALSYLTNQLPVRRVDLESGSADIEVGGRTQVKLESLDAELDVSTNAAQLHLSARSNLCARIRINGKIEGENLAGKLRIAIDQLKIQPVLASLPFAVSAKLPEGETSFAVELAIDGLKKVKATLDGSATSLVLEGGERNVNIQAKGFKGSLVYESQSLLAQVERLDLAAPQLKASGELKIQPDSLSARLRLRDIDIAAVRAAALSLAGNTAAVKQLFEIVHGGAMSEMTLESRAPSFAELALLDRFVMTGAMLDGHVSIPGLDLELSKVNGSLRVAGGILEGQDLAADLGSARAWNGKLRLGLKGQSAPFHLDMRIQAEAEEIRSVLIKLFATEALGRELEKFRNLKGSLSGQVTLGDSLDAVSPVVAVSQADLSASYDRIPFPIEIKSGAFNYRHNRLTVENLNGSIGRSQLSGLNATLHTGATRQMSIDGGPMILDLSQAAALLRSLGDSNALLGNTQFESGRMQLRKLTLTGAYDKPASWRFRGSGRIGQAALHHADLPGRLSVARAEFNANETKIIFSDTEGKLLDASVRGGGTFEMLHGEPRMSAAKGSATVGPQMIQWLARQMELPRELTLRAPLKIGVENFTWRSSREFAFGAKIAAPRGAQISLELVGSPQRVALRHLTIDDGARHAEMTLGVDKDKLDGSFKGELGPQTLEGIFTSFPLTDSSLRGNLRLSGARKQALKFAAQGRLEGRNLWLPVKQEKVLIDRFDIEANDNNLRIRTADLRWRRSRLAVTGSLEADTKALRADMEVIANRLSWPELERSFGAKAEQRETSTMPILPLPPFRGTVRLKADSFELERLKLSPLHATVRIAPEQLAADIDHAVACGINITGRVESVSKNVGLDLKLSATNGDLGTASACLSDRRDDVKGTYSLTANVTGRGEQHDIVKALTGNFEFSAQDGEFVRSPGIDATFDYLNATGDFKMAFPDLDKETFPFRLINVRGRVDGAMLLADEVNVQSTLVNLSGQGKADLERKQVDGKGVIAVLKPVDEVLSRIPLVGSIFGGSLIGIPVRVTGSFDKPQVTYLAPADVGAELLNIPRRILGLPLGAMRLFTPSQPGAEPN